MGSRGGEVQGCGYLGSGVLGWASGGNVVEGVGVGV